MVTCARVCAIILAGLCALGAIVLPFFKAPPLGEPTPINLVGKTFLVTGGTNGLGRWHVEVLMKWNATLVLGVRNAAKGEKLASQLAALNTLAPRPQVYELDMMSLDSVRRFADNYGGPIDVLVLNAGIMGAPPFPKTEDGFDEVLQVNYLAPFLLTALLLPRIEASAAGRIVHITGAIFEHFGQLNMSMVRSEGKTCSNVEERQSLMGNLQGSYADSKLAQVLFNSALARRLKRPAVTHAVHPAIVQTGLGHEALDASLWRKVAYHSFHAVLDRFMIYIGMFQSEEDAPKTQIHISTHPVLQNITGMYYTAMQPPLMSCGREANLCASKDPGPTAENKGLQEELWQTTCEMLEPWLGGKGGVCSRSAVL